MRKKAPCWMRWMRRPLWLSTASEQKAYRSAPVRHAGSSSTTACRSTSASNENLAVIDRSATTVHYVSDSRVSVS